MFLTEAEARKKWCPHARVITDDAGPSNREYVANDPNPDHSRCIASDCSQWRVALRPVHGDAGEIIGTGPTDKGYCGLAGRPEGEP